MELGIEPKRAKVYVGKVMAIKSITNDVSEIIKEAYRLYMMDNMKVKSVVADETGETEAKMSAATTEAGIIVENPDYNLLKEQGLIGTDKW